MRTITSLLIILTLIAGCADTRKPNKWERYGKVYYLDGAGNLGFGQDTVPRALRAAGYRGDFESVIWTSFSGPLGDQVIRINAHIKADDLSKKIIRYRKRYPNTPVYLIGLSAGTGVATWAVEKLPDGIMVDAMVLLGSSLASNYDMTKCLKHIKGKVYVIYSSHDAILTGFIPVTGTIDGSYFVQPAGLIGMYPPEGASKETLKLYKEKIVNIPWRPSFERLGYAGGHTDGTSYAFVKYFIAPRLLGIKREAPVSNKPSTQPAK